MLFLTISKGRHADDAKPVVAVSDQLFVECVLNSMYTIATRRGDETGERSAPQDASEGNEERSGGH